MASPSRSRATKRRRSSTTEHSFQGIGTSRLPLSQAESVTHVSRTICHLCLGSLKPLILTLPQGPYSDFRAQNLPPTPQKHADAAHRWRAVSPYASDRGGRPLASCDRSSPSRLA